MRLKNIPGAKEAVADSPYVVHTPFEKRGHWREVFRKDAPLYIEVGMGKGQFLMRMAELHPERLYVGIEMYDSVLLRALQKKKSLEDAGLSLPNLLFLRLDARLLPEVFDRNEVDGIYLNFSDPWPKARHDKRRLTSRVFLERYNRILKPEGRVEFKTDNRTLFDFSLEEARQDPSWTIEACTYDLHNDPVLSMNNIMTEYEEKFSARGTPISKMIIRFDPGS